MELRTIYSEAGAEIVCRPYLVEDELGRLAQMSSNDFLKFLESEDVDVKNSSILEILNGARHYYLPEAFRERYGIDPNVSSLRAKRFLDKSNCWNVKIWDEKNVKSLWESKNILVPDTVATGTTLAGVLNALLNTRPSGSSLPNVYVFTIAGSDACKEKLNAVHKLLQLHEASLTVVFSNAMFDLASNGTDLGFENAKMNDTAKKKFDEILGSIPRSDMKCAVFDWGDRFRSARDHLLEVRSHFQNVKTSKTQTFILDEIAKRLEDHKTSST